MNTSEYLETLEKMAKQAHYKTGGRNIIKKNTDVFNPADFEKFLSPLKKASKHSSNYLADFNKVFLGGSALHQ